MNNRLDLAALVRWQNGRRRAAGAGASGGDGTLQEVSGFGSNPGALRMLAHLPEGLPAGAPLVVALHGCTQNAGGYDRGCGWSAMADRLGFALLMPEQQRANNASLCFNWFEAGDTARDAGEVLSIRQAIDHLVRTENLDPRRIFITGLSAGGAMTASMLAAYPEVFAGGAIIAGLPAGSAVGVSEALQAMARPQSLSAASRGGSVRMASGGHKGPWPRISIWHGDADHTVNPDNAEESAKQWLFLHGLADAPAVEQRNGGHLRRRWTGPDGMARVELHRIAGMAHGVPLSPGEGDGMCGEAGAYLLDVGVSSTHGALAFWGLEEERAVPAASRPTPQPSPQPAPERARAIPSMAGAMGAMGAMDPGATINRALKAAGLL
ncbi:extracellular catalytic domain type 1 short-chain-length polyhydroxyalkanoate depolymerase [Pararoseomonas indoligenes]|uniref:PHB depolymerase family esterase n=1 Tax=Roseomonas indoligenes TaxID=2820811 RepID=A0A940S613_9PROT|nr:PHB depolymerase family esterase [Pararoseomonas indoligenes]MBP0491473.1 PHB depolymerase family esterase [Pararoseomonas indoligenes]